MAKDVVCKKCKNLVNGWCEKIIDSPDPDIARDCRHFEELADSRMKDVVICHRCAYAEECECDEYVTNEKCKEGIVEWLKQPADEE